MPKVPFWVFIIIALIYLTAIRVDVMDIDAAQYAEISREMLKSSDWLQIYDRQMDYLDKPPFLFWVSALSMKVLGINNLGYKIPSILFALWALYATYRLARRLYDEETGRMAALILATCQGMFLMVNDIRCDTILMSWVITAIWMIQEWTATKKLPWLLGGSAAIAFGMMTKGPIALMCPAFCFVADWALKRQWRQYVRAEYLLALVVMAVLLLPMSMGLYEQYDQHPEKVILGSNHVSGLRFFYWSQSFGRITGESPWKNGVDLSFLFMNMLWSFLPWVFLLVPAVVVNFMVLIRQRLRLTAGQEWVTTGGFLLTYVALGSSAYQLPHYIFVAFPLAAIMVAALIRDFVARGMYARLYAFMLPFQAVVSALVLVAVLLLITYVFPAGPVVLAAWVSCAGAWAYLVMRKGMRGKLLWVSAAAITAANVFMTNHFYHTLLQYQVGSQVGAYIRSHVINTGQVVHYKMEDPLNCVHFYADGLIHSTDTFATDKKYLLTMDTGMANIAKSGLAYKILTQGPVYKVSELTPDFLNPAKRPMAIRHYYLLEWQ